MTMFCDFLGAPRSKRIRLAVMDMWKPFRNRTEHRAPQAAILYDKFHVPRHLNEAADQVRKAEYQRLTDREDRTYIKGQKYVLLSHRLNLSPDKRRRQTLLTANKRLNTAYVLKEQSGQLWGTGGNLGHESSSTSGVPPCGGSACSRSRSSRR